MFRVFFAVMALGLFATALVGCRAEGELGETSSSIVAPN